MESNLVVSQIALAAVSSFALQKLKAASWFPVLTEDSAKVIKVLWGLITSLCAITGISYNYDPVAHTLLIANLSLTAITHGLWNWFSQFVLQEGWYQAVQKQAPALPAPAAKNS